MVLGSERNAGEKQALQVARAENSNCAGVLRDFPRISSAGLQRARGVPTSRIDRLLAQQEVAAHSCIDKGIASGVAAVWQLRGSVTDEVVA